MNIELPNGKIINMDLIVKVEPKDIEYPDKPVNSKLVNSYQIEFYSLPSYSMDGSYGESYLFCAENVAFESKEIRDGVLKNLKAVLKAESIDY